MATVEEIVFKGVDQVSNVIGGIGDKIGSLATLAGGAAVAGVGALAGATAASVAAFNDWAGQLDGLGDVLGTNANDSAMLAVAIEGVGGNVDAITGQMAKLTVGLRDNKGELGPTGQMLADMGIAFEDANGQMLGSTDIIKNVADKISQMPDGLEKSEAMMKLFGKSGKDMTDTLTALTTEGLDAAAKKAADYGLAIGDEGVNSSVEMGKAGKDLEMMLKGMAIQIGGQVLPAVMPLIQTFIGFAREHLPPVIEGLKAFGTWIGDLATKIAAFVQSPAFQEFLANAQAAIKLVAEALMNIAEAVWPTIQEILGLIGELFSTIFGGASTDTETSMNTIKQVIDTVMAAIQLVIETALAAIQTVLKVAIALLQGDWEAAWEAIKTFLEEIWTSIQTAINTALEAIKPLLNNAWESIKTAASDAFEAVKKSITDRLNEAVTFVEELPAKFVAFGKAIIEGIADGIKNGADAVKNALTDFLKRTLPDWALKLLGIASPSRLMADLVGRPIAEGIAVGILEGAGSVAAALDRVVGAGVGMQAGKRSGGTAYTFSDRITVMGNANVARDIAASRREATRQAILRAQVMGG